MKKKNNNFSSARDLIDRRNQLREIEWDKRVNRFEKAEVKDSIWEAYNKLLGNWDFVFASVYYDLLKGQVRAINKTLAVNPPTISGIIPLLNSVINSNNKTWYEELAPFYESMALDFAYLQVELLLPDELKENFVYSETEQEDILRARRRLPRQTILTDGFHPRRKRGQAIPLNRNKYNRDVKNFVSNRLDTYLPDMSNTMKKNLNLALRKSIDQATDLGLVGKEFEDFVSRGISKSLGKKNLGRAMNIARTEATALSNYSLKTSAKQTGLILEKEWITRRDGVVREAHIYMDLKRVPQDTDFSVQGYSMNYPGDSSKGAPAGLVCNCRCTMIFHEVKI
tara:strand:+ start:4658 stop:5674 length:1017 start_codon:yes stop_codon:yes gene_type:complete